jgi:hypothetical protein
MRYWWVNQNQTFRQEIGGDYLWSPKRKVDGARNAFYESMREASPGDLVFSFVDTRIFAISTAQSYCYESPKPVEFGEAGLNWESIGWRIRLEFARLRRQVRPKDHMGIPRSLLPEKYSPLQTNGNDIQSVCLTQLPADFAEALLGLIGARADPIRAGARQANAEFTLRAVNADVELWEHHLEPVVNGDRRKVRGYSSSASWGLNTDAESPSLRIPPICARATVNRGETRTTKSA